MATFLGGIFLELQKQYFFLSGKALTEWNGNGNQLGLYAYNMLASTPGQPPSHGDGGKGLLVAGSLK